MDTMETNADTLATPITVAYAKPMDLIQFDLDDPTSRWYRVLSTSTDTIPGYGKPRVWLTCVALDYEGWPGGHWGFVADYDRPIRWQVDLQPTVLHPIHLAEVA